MTFVHKGAALPRGLLLTPKPRVCVCVLFESFVNELPAHLVVAHCCDAVRHEGNIRLLHTLLLNLVRACVCV